MSSGLDDFVDDHNENDDNKVILSSIEIKGKKDRFELNRRQCKLSDILITALDYDDNKGKTTEIPLHVDGPTLKLIVEYLVHHNGSAPTIIVGSMRYRTMKEVCDDPWDLTFVNDIVTSPDGKMQLYKLASGANYMCINSLMNLACARFACILKGVPLNRFKETLRSDLIKGRTYESDMTDSKREIEKFAAWVR